jgi:hypothetical protein
MGLYVEQKHSRRSQTSCSHPPDSYDSNKTYTRKHPHICANQLMCTHANNSEFPLIPMPLLSIQPSENRRSHTTNSTEVAPEQLTQATLPLEILEFRKRQNKIKTSVVWEWLKVSVGRSDSMKAALFEVTASDLMRHKQHYLWTR